MPCILLTLTQYNIHYKVCILSCTVLYSIHSIQYTVHTIQYTRQRTEFDTEIDSFGTLRCIVVITAQLVYGALSQFICNINFSPAICQEPELRIVR